MADGLSSWNQFLEKVTNEIHRLYLEERCDLPFFRGQSHTWSLKPLIFRVEAIDRELPSLQDVLEIDFKSNCGILYEKPLKSWELYFEMRHANLPTRLLDWTENFATALYFALNDPSSTENLNSGKKNQPCIWILNPTKLNRSSGIPDGIPPAEDSLMPFTYDDLRQFDSIENKRKSELIGLDKEKFEKFSAQNIVRGPFALLPPRAQRRIFAQKSVFTLHVVNTRPIEEIYPNCVKQFNIPLNAKKEAEQFLELAGINEYTVFPDVDGLGRYLTKRHKIHLKEEIQKN